MIIPANWYILQRDGVIYLCYSDDAKTVIRNYSINKNMWLCVYDDTEKYILDPASQHLGHRKRTYNFTVEFCIWNMPRHPD